MKLIFKSSIDDYLFFIVITVGLIFAMQGKAISSHLFNGNGNWIREYNVAPHMLCAVCGGLYQFIRGRNMGLRKSMLFAPAVGFLSVFLIHLSSSSPSILVFSIQLLLLIFACGVIALEPYVKENKFETEFWKLFIESSMKIVRYILMLYIAGFALLKFLSDGVGESKEGFLTSFIYPTVMFVYGIFVIGYWLAIPSWENLVKSYTIDDSDKNITIC